MIIGVRAAPRSMMMFTWPIGLLTQCRNASMEFSNNRAPSMLSTHESIPRKNLRVPWCCMQIFTPRLCSNARAKDIQGKSQPLSPENGDSIGVKMPPPPSRKSNELVDQVLEKLLASALDFGLATLQCIGFEFHKVSFALLDFAADAGVPRAVAL